MIATLPLQLPVLEWRYGQQC